MRDCRLGLSEPRRNGLAHVVMRLKIVCAFLIQREDLIVTHRRGIGCGRHERLAAISNGNRHRRSARSLRAGASTFLRRFDIVFDNTAVRAGSLDQRKIDASLSGKASRQR